MKLSGLSGIQANIKAIKIIIEKFLRQTVHSIYIGIHMAIWNRLEAGVKLTNIVDLT